MTTNLAISEWIIEELIGLDATRFVISPGSRSTPLTVAVARNPQAKTTTHFDERGAAFFALGHAKATGKPAVLICTSGTAVANYFPAVVEASMDNIPLIILSADRPPELIGVGANQAIFQDNIYGNYPRLFKNLEPPRSNTDSEQVSTLVTELYHAATGSRPGPVHLNCQFREPLLPALTDNPDHNDIPTKTDGLNFEKTEHVEHAVKGESQPTPHPPLPVEQLELITKQIMDCPKGLIIVGRSVDAQYEKAILNLAESLNWPIFPDVQSRLRFTQHPDLINHFDLVLLKDEMNAEKPDMVIHLGGPYTSKRLLTYLNDSDSYYISVRKTPEQIDPNHQVDLVLQMDVGEFCISIDTENNNEGWIKSWNKAEAQVSKIIQDQFDQDETLSEPGISYQLSRSISNNHDLMVANSMAVREMEMFGALNKFGGRIFANRGASGIDGLCATAAGFQAGSGKALTLLIGDLAILHDLNSLSLISKSKHPIIIVLINNDGGGIFSFLPVRSETDIFESFFGTPHGWTFDKVAGMFALEYAKPKDLIDFQQVYSASLTGDRSMIIEIQTDRAQNHLNHQAIFKAIRES